MKSETKRSTVRLVISLLLVGALLAGVPGASRAQDVEPAQGDGYALFLPAIVGGAGHSYAAFFPENLAVASPLDLHYDGPVSASATAGDWVSGYAIATAEIHGVMTGATAIADVFDAGGLLALGNDASCYGPTLRYRNHPDDGGADPTIRELPHGDLGLWQETDTAGEACAAAQVNARLGGAEKQSQASLNLMAALLAAADDAGIALPTAGGTVDVTAEMNAAGIPDVLFSAATITYDATAGTWTYYAEFTYTDPADGSTHDMVVSLEYTPDATAPESRYTGVMYFRANDDQAWGNCPASGGGGGGGGGATARPVTVNGSLAFNRLGGSELRIQQRSGAYCGHDVDARHVGVVDPTLNWGDNYASFTANFDPANMAGDYAYAWQAGVHDRASRVLNLGVNNHSPLDGEAYFGYGARVQDDSDGVLVADGIYCNWAAPGSSGGMQAYAQRQFVTFNTGTGHFYMPAGGSDMRYAPTNSCQYDGTDSFWYDRDLDGTVNETTDDLAVTPTSANPFDLMAAVETDGDGTPTIAEAIAARGYDEPVAP